MSEYEPWMKSLLNRMKELYNKPNAKSIAEALPEVGSGGGSAEVTPASIVTATGQMTEAQAAAVRRNLGAGSVNPPEIVEIEQSSAAIEPADNTVFKCGTLTSLTIYAPVPVSGAYSIVFTSGATATVVSGIDNFNVEPNKRYRIDVEDGYATYDSWSVGGGT